MSSDVHERGRLSLVWWVLVTASLLAGQAYSNPYLTIANSQNSLLLAAAILLVETVFLYWLLRRFHFRRRTFLPLLFLINLVTWTIFHLLVLFTIQQHWPRVASVTVLEFVVALVEAYALVDLSTVPFVRRQEPPNLKWRQALVASGVANAFSLSLGFFVYWMPRP